MGRAPGVINDGDLTTRRELLQKQLEANVPLTKELLTQFNTVKDQLSEYPDIRLNEIETVLKPIRAAALVQESTMGELQVQLAGLVIRAPIDGVISAGDLKFSIAASV